MFGDFAVSRDPTDNIPLPSPNRVTLVGAGPSAADLLTLRALKAIEQADVVVYDALVGGDVLRLIPEAARKIEVGKRGHRISTAQSFINRLMVKLAKTGANVVRLKGGDPSIFGRSSEEVAFLEAAGIGVDIVPGVTTASAAAAQFGFSLSKRGVAQRVLFATGRTALGAQGDWAGAGDPLTTLCLYMGCGDIAEIATRLIDLDRRPTTPTLVAYNVGRPDARLITATLADLPEIIAAQSHEGPGLIIIGEVCRDAKAQSNLAQDLYQQLTHHEQVA
jgi:uroporphyrin-III C-methyltransferase